MDIIGIGIELISGALTGYITNSIAIKMLFKNYGPFGGVIVKTKNEFIENISQLVERDIINENTLRNNLGQTKLQNNIDTIFEYFTQQALIDSIGDRIISDIPGLEQTTDNLVDFLNSPIYYNYLKGIFSDIKLKQIISENQFEYISQQLIKGFLSITNNSPNLKEQFNILFSEINNKNFNLLFPQKLINTLTENILNTFMKFSEKPEVINNKLNFLINNTYNHLNIEQICGKLLKIIENKKFRDYKIDEKYLSSILLKMKNLINSPTGEEYIISTYKKIKDSIRKERLTIYSLLQPEPTKNTDKVIANKVEGTLSILSDWLSENHNSIDNIFNKTLIKVFNKEAYQSSWKALLKKNIYQYYLKKTRLTPTQILTNSLAEPDIKYSIKNKIYKNLNKFMDDIIIKEKRDNRKIIISINSCIDQIKRNSSAKLTDNIIGEYVDLSELKPGSLSNNKFITKKIVEHLIFNFEKEIKNIGNSKLSDFIQNKESGKYYQKVTSILENNQAYLEKGLKRLYEIQKNKTLVQIINPEIRNILKKHITTSIKEQFMVIKELKANDLLSKINYNFGFYKKTKKILLEQFYKNLPVLLNGKVSSVIKNNLKSVNDNDLKNMLENLIGRELKPITYFGAFLGIFSAFFIYLLRTNIGILPSFQLHVSMLTYGFIGYITNVIAIKMIFRPYEKKKFLGFPLPFTPGIISKEKERFANSIGNFIDRELLNSNTIKNSLQNKKEYIVNTLTEIMIKKGYQFPRRLLKENRENISSGLINLIQEKKKIIIKKTARSLSTDSSRYNPDLPPNIEKNFVKYSKNFSKEIFILLNKKANNNISSTLTETFINKTKETVTAKTTEKIDNYYSLLKDSNVLETTLSDFFDNLYEDIKEYQAADLPEEIKKSLSSFLYNSLEKITASKSSNLKIYINNLINSKTMLLLKKSPESISANRYMLKNEIKKQFKAKLGFWAKVGKLVDIDFTLDEFINTFITEGLPEIIDLFLKEKSGDIIKELELSEDEVSQIIKELLSNKDLKKIIIENINLLIDNSSITLNDIFRILNLKKPSQLINIFYEEISLLKENLARNLENNMENLTEELSKLLHDLLKQYLNNTKLNNLMMNIDQKLIKETLEHLYRELNSHEQLNNLVSIILKELLNLNQIDKILKEDYLEKDLNELYKNLLHNKDVCSLFNKIYIDTVEQLPEIIDKKTGDYIINIVVISIFSTLEKWLPQLVKDINVKKITVEQIENMDSRRIEELFYSFAGKYFTKLEHYGWLGAIIGLLTVLVNLYI